MVVNATVAKTIRTAEAVFLAEKSMAKIIGQRR